MKIAIDLTSIREDGSAGGATGFAIELVKGLVQRKDIEILILCTDVNYEYLKYILPKQIVFYQTNARLRNVKSDIIKKILNRIAKHTIKNDILKKYHIELLYCPFSAATYKESGIPTISTILDIQHEYYPQFFAPKELNHRRIFYKDIAKRVEAVTCISDFTKDTFCDTYNFSKENAHTIYIAIQNRFHEEDTSVLANLGLIDNEYIVYPANFWEHKNHRLLLNAFSMYCADSSKNIKLVLTGNTLQQDDYYKEILEILGIMDKVVITGYLNDCKLYSILKHSRGLIYPSLFEGFGIPVVEAMFLHKLIASSNLTSLPEIGCEEIFYFNPKKPDEILKGIQYLTENEINNTIISKYEEKLKAYDSKVMVDKYADIFKNTIENKEKIIFEDQFNGIYEDSWSKKQFSVQLKQHKGEFLNIAVSQPSFLNYENNLKIKYADNIMKYKIKAGETKNIKMEIKDVNATVEFILKKSWQPHKLQGTDDCRDLGVIIESLSIEALDGKSTIFK